MGISVFHGLEGVIGEVERQLEIANNEREELGLAVPKDFDVYMYFSSRGRMSGVAYPEHNGRPLIGLFLLENIVSFLPQKKEDEDLQIVQKYFDVLYDVFGNVPETIIYGLFSQGEEEIQEFEEKFATREYLQAFKQQYQHRNKREYEQDVAYLLGNAVEVQEHFEKLLLKMVALFPKAGTRVLRHELDHIDFFQSKLHNQCAHYESLLKKVDGFSDDDIKNLDFGSAKVNQRLFKLQRKLWPIMEGRALFFDNIQPDKWYCADFDAVAQRVQKTLQNNYLNGEFSLLILNRLVDAAKIRHGLSEDTKQYIYHKWLKRNNDKRARFYHFQEEQVDRKLALRILYMDLPFYKATFVPTIQEVVPALRAAYMRDASRLVTANMARNYTEFLQCCYGIKQ